MVALITIEEIQPQSETDWSTSQTARATSLLAGVLAWITRNAPCLAVEEPEPTGRDEARMIIAEAILRAVDGSGNVGSEGAGPFQINYIDRAALPTLTKADESALRALCPKSVRRRYSTIRTRPGY